jgi:hypothetical protein
MASSVKSAALRATTASRAVMPVLGAGAASSADPLGTSEGVLV